MLEWVKGAVISEKDEVAGGGVGVACRWLAETETSSNPVVHGSVVYTACENGEGIESISWLCGLNRVLVASSAVSRVGDGAQRQPTLARHK